MFQNIDKSDLVNSIIKDVFTTDKYSSSIIDPGEESEYVYIPDDEGIPGESIERLNSVMRQNLVLHIRTKNDKIVDLQENPRCFILIEGADFDGVYANAVRRSELPNHQESILKEKVLIEESASHLINDIDGTILAEAGVWSIKVDDVITFVEGGDVFVDEDGDEWIKAGTNIVPLKGAEEDISVSMSLRKDQLDAVYNLFNDDGILKGKHDE